VLWNATSSVIFGHNLHDNIQAKEKPQKGTVVAVGDGAIAEDGTRRPLDVSEGDEVLYSKYGGTDITVEGEELLVLRESDVLAKVQ
jgi:chaperonin GroES